MLCLCARAAVAVVAGVLLALASSAGASAAPAPFGHACVAQLGVRFCPTTDLGSRVASFDGTPIDVDVTLPATGDGPFPTVLLLHGLGQDKTAFQGTANRRYSNWAFAQQGYAVVQPTARGFGRSCGVPESRTPDCATGWTRLGDMRYEVRDIQTLVGRLVDDRVADPRRIGSTGISYGGGFSTMLAYLRDRVRLPDGSFAPWRSPGGVPIRLAAAWPRWMWTNGESIFTRNGRGAWSRRPVGVEAQQYAAGIFAVGLSGFVAPTGGDISTDIVKWKQQLDTGRFDPSVQPTLDVAHAFHGVAGIARTSTPAPLLMQSGWTDALFPVPQALAAYDGLRARNTSAPIALQLSDAGHSPGANNPREVATFERQGQAFFSVWLKGSGSRPRPGAVTAYRMRCPAPTPAATVPYRAASYAALRRGVLRLRTARRLTITSAGADAALAQALAPPLVGGDGAQCRTYAVDRTSRATVTGRSPGATLLGLPVVTGTVRATGDDGQIDGRLWDLDPATGRQRLITRGAYRLTDDQRGRFRFRLDGNGWRFAEGHRIVLELLGRDAPTYGASPTAFRATLSDIAVELPVRDRPSRARAIAKP
jgi:hypothetical protein